VLDPESDEAVSEAEVLLKTKDGQELSKAQTDAEGKFAFDGFAGDQYKLVITKEGYEDEYMTVNTTEGSKDLGEIYPTKQWAHPYTRK